MSHRSSPKGNKSMPQQPSQSEFPPQRRIPGPLARSLQDSPNRSPPSPGRKNRLMRLLRRNSSRVANVEIDGGGEDKKTLKGNKSDTGSTSSPVATPLGSRKKFKVLKKVKNLPGLPFKFLIPKLKSRHKKNKLETTTGSLPDSPLFHHGGTTYYDPTAKEGESKPSSKVKKKEKHPTTVRNSSSDYYQNINVVKTPETPKKTHTKERQNAQRRKSDRKRGSFREGKSEPARGGDPLEGGRLAELVPAQHGGPAQFSSDIGMKPYTVTITVKPSEKPGEKPSLVADIQPVKWTDPKPVPARKSYKPKYRRSGSGRLLSIIPPIPIYQTRYVTARFRIKGCGIGALTPDILSELASWGKDSFVICAEILWSSPVKLSMKETEFDMNLAKNVEQQLKETKARLSRILTGKRGDHLPEHSIENVYTRGESGNVLALHRCYTKQLLNEFTHNEAADRHRSVWHFRPGQANWNDIVGKQQPRRLRTTTLVNLSLVCLQLREDTAGSHLMSSQTASSKPADETGILSSISSKIRRQLSSSSSFKKRHRGGRRSPSVTDVDSGVEDSTSLSPTNQHDQHDSSQQNWSSFKTVKSDKNKDNKLLSSPLAGKRHLPPDDAHVSLGSQLYNEFTKPPAEVTTTCDRVLPSHFNLKIVPDIPLKIAPKIIRRVESVKKRSGDTATETIYVTTTFEINEGIAESSFYQDLIDELRRWSMEDFVVCCEILWSTPACLRDPKLEHEIREAVRRKLVPVKFDLCQFLGKDHIPRSQCQESSKNHRGLFWTGGLRYHTPTLVRLAHREAEQEHLPFWSFHPEQAPWRHILDKYSEQYLKHKSVVKLNFICLKFM